MEQIRPHAPTVLFAGKWPHFSLSMKPYGPQKIRAFGGETKIYSAFVRDQTDFMAWTDSDTIFTTLS